jgi:hypothetical protein
MCVRSPFLYDTPFLMQLVSTMHSFKITNRIMRRCSMFLDLNMEYITQPIASNEAKGIEGGMGSISCNPYATSSL